MASRSQFQVVFLFLRLSGLTGFTFIGLPGRLLSMRPQRLRLPFQLFQMLRRGHIFLWCSRGIGTAARSRRADSLFSWKISGFASTAFDAGTASPVFGDVVEKAYFFSFIFHVIY